MIWYQQALATNWEKLKDLRASNLNQRKSNSNVHLHQCLDVQQNKAGYQIVSDKEYRYIQNNKDL